MKKLFIASIIGMTIFQSCTKESKIQPVDAPNQISSSDAKAPVLTPKGCN